MGTSTIGFLLCGVFISVVPCLGKPSSASFIPSKCFNKYYIPDLETCICKKICCYTTFLKQEEIYRTEKQCLKALEEQLKKASSPLRSIMKSVERETTTIKTSSTIGAKDTTLRITMLPNVTTITEEAIILPIENNDLPALSPSKNKSFSKELSRNTTQSQANKIENCLELGAIIAHEEKSESAISNMPELQNVVNSFKHRKLSMKSDDEDQLSPKPEVVGHAKISTTLNTNSKNLMFLRSKGISSDHFNSTASNNPKFSNASKEAIKKRGRKSAAEAKRMSRSKGKPPKYPYPLFFDDATNAKSKKSELDSSTEKLLNLKVKDILDYPQKNGKDAAKVIVDVIDENSKFMKKYKSNLTSIFGYVTEELKKMGGFSLEKLMSFIGNLGGSSFFFF